MPRLKNPPPQSLVADPGPLLKKAEVAARLAISTRKLDKMIASGQFPGGTYALGRCPRWPSAVVNEWVNFAVAKG